MALMLFTANFVKSHTENFDLLFIKCQVEFGSCEFWEKRNASKNMPKNMLNLIFDILYNFDKVANPKLHGGSVYDDLYTFFHAFTKNVAVSVPPLLACG